MLSVALPLTADTLWQRNVAFPLTGLYNLNLPDTLAPDSMQIIIFSSLAAAPARGTTLWIDSLHFDASVNPVVIGVKDISVIRSISVYPNPADSRASIRVEDEIPGSRLMLINTAGELVYDEKMEKRISDISTQALPAGIYYIRIADSDGTSLYRSTLSVVH